MQKPESGGFEKRTILAFALMILVWVVFTQLMPKPRRVPQGTAGQMVEEGAATPADSAAAVSSGGASRTTASQEPVAGVQGAAARDSAFVNRLPAVERQITVDGPLYTATFDARGGVLSSLKLKKYTDASEQPVELVQQSPGALGLRMDTPQGQIDFSETVFQGSEADAGSAAAGAQTRTLSFTAEVLPDGQTPVRVARIYRIDPNRYDWEMEVSVTGVDNLRKDHQLEIGWERGIPNLERQPRLERSAKGAVALLAKEVVRHGFGTGTAGCGCGCGSGPASQGGERIYEGGVRWAGVRGKYFGALLIPREEVPAAFIAQSEPAADAVGMRLRLPMEFEGPTRYTFSVFAGPVDYEVLKELDGRLHKDAVRLVDFGAKVIAPLSKATYWFMRTVHSVLPNYGVVIIALSIFVRLLFHPFNQKALQSQRKMQALKPEMDEINKKYKDNPEQRSKKQMELYKTHGINPLGGCLPLVIQLPVFYGLYNVLMNTIALRKEPFILWMKDLAAPDKVGEIMGVPINILPLLMGLTMFIQQKLTPTDPRQAPMLVLMPLMMIFFFYGLPSGLVLYWTMTNVLAVGQQLLMKQQPVLETASAGEDTGRRRRFGR